MRPILVSLTLIAIVFLPACATMRNMEKATADLAAATDTVKQVAALVGTSTESLRGFVAENKAKIDVNKDDRVDLKEMLAYLFTGGGLGGLGLFALKRKVSNTRDALDDRLTEVEKTTAVLTAGGKPAG